MPAKKYLIDLQDQERSALHDLTSKGRVSARKLKRAQILLLADKGQTDEEIVQAVGVVRATVERIRKRFVEGGLEYALNEQPRPGGRPKLEGHQVWTMQLLADRLVELGEVESVSHDTVRRVLKKTRPSPG